MIKKYEEPWMRHTGLSVEVRNNDVKTAIRILNKKIQRDGLLKNISERKHFTKKSLKRRLKHKRAVVNERKRQNEVKNSL